MRLIDIANCRNEQWGTSEDRGRERMINLDDWQRRSRKWQREERH